jgi:flagellar hook-basal body complex protein FliE
MININTQYNPVAVRPEWTAPKTGVETNPDTSFADQVKEVGKALAKVDDLQQVSDASIQELLTGKNTDITSVVSAVAKADMSFKLLVGVRNKLIEAYKQTMNMPL